MSVLRYLSNAYRIDSSKQGSSDDEISQLVLFADVKIPSDFIEFIRESSEVEINVQESKYLRIWGATGCIEMNEAYNIQQYIPKSLAIADDEGGNALIYTTGINGFGLYLVAFNDLDIDELVFVSDSLSNLLKNNDGINAFIKA